MFYVGFSNLHSRRVSNREWFTMWNTNVTQQSVYSFFSIISSPQSLKTMKSLVKHVIV